MESSVLLVACSYPFLLRFSPRLSLLVLSFPFPSLTTATTLQLAALDDGTYVGSWVSEAHKKPAGRANGRGCIR